VIAANPTTAPESIRRAAHAKEAVVRMRSSITLLAAALSLPAGGCMMKPRNLVYPQGVTFTGWHPPNFESCTWRRDPNNPGPCALVVHRPGGDLGDKEFADANVLR